LPHSKNSVKGRRMYLHKIVGELSSPSLASAETNKIILFQLDLDILQI